MRLTMTDWEAFTPFEILGRLQGLKWQQEQALAALAGKLAGTPPALATAASGPTEAESQIIEDSLCHAEDSMTSEMPESSLSDQPTIPTFRVERRCKCAPIPSLAHLEVLSERAGALRCLACGALWAYVRMPAPAADRDT